MTPTLDLTSKETRKRVNEEKDLTSKNTQIGPETVSQENLPGALPERAAPSSKRGKAVEGAIGKRNEIEVLSPKGRKEKLRN